MAHRIYIIEDHPVMRKMIRDLLTREADIDVCGTAASGEEALENFAAAEPDVALIDTSLPGMNGVDLMQEMLKRRPDLRCLMYSGHGNVLHVERALAAGAHGYVVKGDDPDELAEAIRSVVDNTVYLSKSLRDAQEGV